MPEPTVHITLDEAQQIADLLTVVAPLSQQAIDAAAMLRLRRVDAIMADPTTSV